MKLKAPKLAQRIAKHRADILEAKEELNQIKWVALRTRIPNFFTWFSGSFAPEGTPHNKPLFFGIAYTKTKRGNEGMKTVALYRDGTLQIKESHGFDYRQSAENVSSEDPYNGARL